MGSPDTPPDVEIIAPEERVSFWGAPMTHDGALETEAVIWVDRLTDITPEGWERILRTMQINWVIIPLRTSNVNHQIRAESR